MPYVMSEAMKPVLSVKNLFKSYQNGPESVAVWQDISFEVFAGQSLSIVGDSGSGKTTLLNALAGLDDVDQGQVVIDQQSIFHLSDGDRTELRNRSIGFVYQFHHLLAEFSAVENAAMPLLLSGVSKNEAFTKATELLQQLGLGHRLEHRPAELSGGERQRTAIARALVHDPQLVLLDEPTGNLDATASENVEQLLDELRKTRQTSFILVTHDTKLAAKMDQQYRLQDRQLKPLGLIQKNEYSVNQD